MEELKLLTDGEIILKLSYHAQAFLEYPEAYYYNIYLANSNVKIGQCGVRLGNTEGNYYIGNFEYEIDPKFRGCHYAEKACLLLKEVALQCGMREITITTQSNNFASRRTIERLGGTFIEHAKVPTHHRLYRHGIVAVDVYGLQLERGKRK